MTIKFEIVSKYKDKGINLPKRSTKYSAGYDIEAAEDVVIPSHYRFIENFTKDYNLTTDQIKSVVKELGIRVMVPTGLRVKMPENMYLKLYMRSGIGSNCLLTLANGTGIIDADYYNADNEGHIFIPLINLTPMDIKIRKGEKIAQGIFSMYFVTDDDVATGERKGGFGSTSIDPHIGIPADKLYTGLKITDKKRVYAGFTEIIDAEVEKLKNLKIQVQSKINNQIK